MCGTGRVDGFVVLDLLVHDADEGLGVFEDGLHEFDASWPVRSLLSSSLDGEDYVLQSLESCLELDCWSVLASVV